MIKQKQLEKGVELCLKNGINLLEDAHFLEQNKRFSSAIPLFVIAYEEMNKALFLEDTRYLGKDISDKEYSKIFSKGSHIKKIILDYEMKKKALEDMSEEEFLYWSNYSKAVDMGWWQNSRKDAIIRCKNSVELCRKLNKLKKNFMYVDYSDKKWKSSQTLFGKKLLSNICNLIYYMCLDMYYTINIYHNFYDGTKKDRLTKIHPKVFSDDPNFIELKKIRKMYRTQKWKNVVLHAINLLNSI